MKVLFHNYYDEINQGNTLFEKENVLVGDNLLKPYNILAKEAKKLGINVATYAKMPLEEADCFVFIDYPKKGDAVLKYATDHKKPMFLISAESPIISKGILDEALHRPFIKIFTWSDALVSSNPDKYVKLNYLHDIKADFNINEKRGKQFVIIAGNKASSSYNELYSLRKKCALWFEKYHPEDLDLYGIGWDLHAFSESNYIGKVINHQNRRFKIFKNKISLYKGPVARKAEILKQYNFSVCFENVYGFDGYITEKIFDCLLAGTIPIYKGAPNIDQHIPSNCFLKFDDFANFESMYSFIMQMSDDAIINFRSNIYSFLLSDKAENFRASFLSNTILPIIQNTFNAFNNSNTGI